MSLLDDSEALRNRIISGLEDKLPDIEDAVLRRLLRLLEELDSEGGYFTASKTSTAKLMALQKEVEGILQQSGYFKAANTFIADLKKITDNTIELQKGINNLDIQRRSLNAIEGKYVSDVAQIMSEGGLSVNFVNPVTNALNEAVTYGYSIQSTRDNLVKSLTGDGAGEVIQGVRSLKSYLTVTARDTVSQLQGAQQQAIAVEYKMPYVRYVGALLEDSRAQCVRWKGMKYLEVAELQQEIDRAIKLQREKAKEGKHKYSGMILDTNAQNFCVKRGGFGCLHSAMPTLKKY